MVKPHQQAGALRYGSLFVSRMAIGATTVILPDDLTRLPAVVNDELHSEVVQFFYHESVIAHGDKLVLAPLPALVVRRSGALRT